MGSGGGCEKERHPSHILGLSQASCLHVSYSVLHRRGDYLLAAPWRESPPQRL
jgi:hypothetical protein